MKLLRRSAHQAAAAARSARGSFAPSGSLAFASHSRRRPLALAAGPRFGSRTHYLGRRSAAAAAAAAASSSRASDCYSGEIRAAENPELIRILECSKGACLFSDMICASLCAIVCARAADVRAHHHHYCFHAGNEEKWIESARTLASRTRRPQDSRKRPPLLRLRPRLGEVIMPGSRNQSESHQVGFSAAATRSRAAFGAGGFKAGA